MSCKRFACLLFLPILSLAQTIPAHVREMLASEFKFSDTDFVKIESGQAVAHLVTTGRPDDVRMAGIVLIKTSSDAYVKAFHDIEKFQEAKEVVRTRRFSSPPVASDLADLHFHDLKKSEIMACHPGRCSYKLPAEAMTQLQTNIDWNAPDAAAKADELVHERCLNYLNLYRKEGDRALAVYYDTASPYSVAEGLHSLIGAETNIAKVTPNLIRFATEYPQEPPANTDDFFYWQEAAFGLKHVLRVEHVIVQRLPNPGYSHYAIVTKMLFATHYFRAAFEFQYVYPVRTPSGDPAVFLISAQRSYVDGLTGVKGAIIRKVAEGRSPASLAQNLQLAKERLEKQ